MSLQEIKIGTFGLFAIDFVFVCIWEKGNLKSFNEILDYLLLTSHFTYVHIWKRQPKASDQHKIIVRSFNIEMRNWLATVILKTLPVNVQKGNF